MRAKTVALPLPTVGCNGLHARKRMKPAIKAAGFFQFARAEPARPKTITGVMLQFSRVPRVKPTSLLSEGILDDFGKKRSIFPGLAFVVIERSSRLGR